MLFGLILQVPVNNFAMSTRGLCARPYFTFVIDNKDIYVLINPCFEVRFLFLLMPLVGYASPVGDRPRDTVGFESSWSILTFENSPEVYVPAHPTVSLGLTTDITNNNQYIKHCVYDRHLLCVCFVNFKKMYHTSK